MTLPLDTSSSRASVRYDGNFSSRCPYRPCSHAYVAIACNDTPLWNSHSGTRAYRVSVLRPGNPSNTVLLLSWSVDVLAGAPGPGARHRTTGVACREASAPATRRVQH